MVSALMRTYLASSEQIPPCAAPMSPSLPQQ
jgi:hypothetical protein